ncbi:MAG: hypothetical protein AAB692_00925 [Patescibacteria group bacterium]
MRQFFIAAALMASAIGCVSPYALRHDRDDPFVRRFDGNLYLRGVRYPLVGIDARTLASSVPSDKISSCGHWYAPEEIDDLFHKVRESGGTAVRLWAFRSFTEEGRSFRQLDYVIARAKAYDVRLVLALVHRHGACDGGKLRDTVWYRRGYRQGGDGFGQTYLDHVRGIVERYRDEPTVAMWQLTDADPWTGPPVDDNAVFAFAQDVAYEIKKIDRNHLVAFGPDILHGSKAKPFAAIPWVDVHMGSDTRRLWIRAWSENAYDCVAAAKKYRKACIMSPIGVDLSRDTRPLKDLYATMRDGQVASALITGVDGSFIAAQQPGDPMIADPDGVSPAIRALRFLVHFVWDRTGRHPPY